MDPDWTGLIGDDDERDAGNEPKSNIANQASQQRSLPLYMCVYVCTISGRREVDCMYEVPVTDRYRMLTTYNILLGIIAWKRPGLKKT